ncbi:MAG: hypothetical protein QG620_669 [Patescibacteria group bacterium]|nr:hypothetical protein [Patescibacteria group bacterium]
METLAIIISMRIAHYERASRESQALRKNKMQAQSVQEKVHSQMLKAGSKVYFFDVKKASNGSNYLSIAESYTKKDGQKVNNRLTIFKDNFSDFGNTLLGLKEYFQ